MTFSTIKSHFFGYVNALTEHRCAESPCSHKTFDANVISRFSIDSKPCEGEKFGRKYICEIIFTDYSVHYVKLSFPEIAAACHSLSLRGRDVVKNNSNEKFSLQGKIEDLRLYASTMNPLLNDAYRKDSPIR